MDDKVNLAEKLQLLDKPYSPGVVGYLNDYKLVVVKVQGEFVWHKHDDTDDFFLVLRGHLTIQLRDRNVELGEGELFVVPRGVEHCPKADQETHVLLIEPKGTVNTGDAGGELDGRRGADLLEPVRARVVLKAGWRTGHHMRLSSSRGQSGASSMPMRRSCDAIRASRSGRRG